MRLNVLAVHLRQSNFVSLFVVYILISVFSVVCCENVTSNAINRVSPMAATAAVTPTNSTQSSTSLTSAAAINKTIAFTIDAGIASTITTTTVQPSLVDVSAAAAAAAATAMVTSQVHHQKERPQQKSTPLQKLQQQRPEKQQQRAKGNRPPHGNRLFFFSFSPLPTRPLPSRSFSFYPSRSFYIQFINLFGFYFDFLFVFIFVAVCLVFALTSLVRPHTPHAMPTQTQFSLFVPRRFVIVIIIVGR